MSDFDNKNKKTGFVALYRSIINWEWFTDVNTAHLFLYCLLRVNFEDTEWRGIKIKKGSFITSLENLSKSTGLTIQQVRTAISKLKLTHEITYKSTNKNSIITVNKWDYYQEVNIQLNNQITSNQQTNNKQITTDNNINNITNKQSNNKDKSLLLHIEKKNKKEFKKFGEFKNVFLNEEQVTKLKAVYSDRFDEAIEILSSYIESKNVKYKNHYAVLGRHNWVYRSMYQSGLNTPKTKQEEGGEYNGYTFA